MKDSLLEMFKKTYQQELNDDELFFIYTHLSETEVSILFSTRSLVMNLIKQGNLHPSLIHIDGTFKLIDLGLPVLQISTETLEHNYRPICFFITYSESKEKAKQCCPNFQNL